MDTPTAVVTGSVYGNRETGGNADIFSDNFIRGEITVNTSGSVNVNIGSKK